MKNSCCDNRNFDRVNQPLAMLSEGGKPGNNDSSTEATLSWNQNRLPGSQIVPAPIFI
jgi:hypothetical protein